MKRFILGVLFLVLLLGLGGTGLLTVVVTASPEVSYPPVPGTPYIQKEGDAELAYLLVKLELNTRTVIASHYTRLQSSVPGVDLLYKRWLAKNAVLPAAVADRIFSEVVPGATGGRAWVKMVVLEPRNPNNIGDSVALEMLGELRQGAPRAEKATAEAVYYAEPIVSTETCLVCHGSPRGEPDPLFPQYQKDGWAAGEVVGAVVSRVAPGKKSF